MNGFNQMMILSLLSFCSFVFAMDISDQQLIDQVLFDSSRKGEVQHVQNLLKARANVNARYYTSGCTPLHWAAHFGHEAVVRLLLENNADIEARDNDGRTPLHWAAARGHEAVVRLLLENKAYIEARDNDGRTPLYYAVRKDYKAVVRLLEGVLKLILKNSREKNLAFCMAQHSRLGAHSSANVLPNELFWYIYELAKPTLEDVDKTMSQ